MITPIIKYSDWFLDKISVLFKIKGITLFPYIVLREKHIDDKVLINHEMIHIEQQKEMLIIFFYLVYVIEFIIRLIITFNIKKAYESISLEAETKYNKYNLNYLNERKSFHWIKFIKNGRQQ